MINLYESELKSILPNNLKTDIKTQAFCYAVDKQIQKLLDTCLKIGIWSDINSVDAGLLDYLASELRTQYYDTELSESIKRQLISNTMIWYQKAGTVKAVEELITAVLGSGEIKEWYQYEGQPHHYKVRSPNVTINEDNVQEFNTMVEKIKRKTAVLDTIEITLDTSMDDNYGFSISTGDFITINQEVD